jgi:uncharacterized protein (TIGR04255 family)
MPEPRPLRRAPITEALIDFRIAPPISAFEQKTVGLHERIRGEYPKSEERKKFQAQLKVTGGKIETDTTELGIHGQFFKTEDEKTIAQFRADGFTLNRLNPYTSWLELFPEAMRLWDLYVELSAARSTSRLALRYINNLVIPWHEGESFETYLLAPPVVPEPLPQSVSAFLIAYSTHDPATEIGANISQRLKPGPMGTLLLDIDVYKVGPFAVEDRDTITRTFDSLHDMKNRVFFNMVTEKCLQLFQ